MKIDRINKAHGTDKEFRESCQSCLEQSPESAGLIACSFSGVGDWDKLFANADTLRRQHIVVGVD
jgi:hypothetical protein